MLVGIPSSVIFAGVFLLSLASMLLVSLYFWVKRNADERIILVKSTQLLGFKVLRKLGGPDLRSTDRGSN